MCRVLWFLALWPDGEAFSALEASLLCTVCLVKVRLERTKDLLQETIEPEEPLYCIAHSPQGPFETLVLAELGVLSEEDSEEHQP